MDNTQKSMHAFFKRDSRPSSVEKEDANEGTFVTTSTEHLNAKRPKIARNFRESWLAEFLWLRWDSENSFMLCSVCKCAGRKNPFTFGCTNFQHSTLKRHLESKDHIESVKVLEMQKHFKVTARNVIQVDESQHNAQTDGHIKQLRTVYFMAKKNCPADIYTDIMELQVLNGVSNCQHYYRKHEVVEEMEQCIFLTIENKLVEEVKQSPFFGIMLDETCDISIEKKLAIYIRYVEVNTGTVKVSFIGNEHITDCTAAGLEEALLTFLHRKTYISEDNSNLFKLMGLGTDGAAVMTGRVNGLGARLRRRNPPLVQVHCAAHRLNLAASQAGKDIPYLVEYHRNIGTLYRYFNDSSVKYDKLRELQEVLHGHRKQVKEPSSVRWLSIEAAVKMIFEYYDALIVCLESADARQDPKAVALYNFMSSAQFLLTTALLVDVLCIIGILSLIFQRDKVNLSDIRSNVETTKSTLQTMKQGSQNVDKIWKDLSEATSNGNKTKIRDVEIKDNGQLRERFRNLRERYISSLKVKLDERFPQDDLNIIECFDMVFNPKKYPSKHEDLLQYGNEQLEILLQHFSEYVVRDRAFNHFLIFKHHVSSFKGACDFNEVCRNVIRDQKDTFPDFVVLAEIASVIPVSSATCERGFSVQNGLKTNSRNRLTPSRLNRLMFIKLQGPPLTEFDFDTAVRMFRNKKRRK